jgi:glycosyltransferase involved in cell wall biosynthesis
MKVSVIIATYKRSGPLKAAIDSILLNIYTDFDLTIVDQSENNETRNLVDAYRRYDNRIEYLWSKKGKSKALNLAIKKTKGEIIALIDDDCVVIQDWVEKIVSIFDKYKNADIIFGNVTVPHGTDPIDGINPLGGVTPCHYAKDSWLNTRWSMGGRLLGIGANMAFRREVFEKIWGFDEYLGPGSDLGHSLDWDFAYRALSHGLKIFDSSSFTVVHYGQRNPEETFKLLKDYELTTAAFFWKNFRCGDIAAPWIGLSIAILKTFKRLRIAFCRKLSKTPRMIFVFRVIYFYVIYGQYLQYLLGICKAMKYNVDKKRCLFIPKSN